MATAAQQVAAIERALAESPAGVVQVTVDATTVRYDRQQAIEELKYWRGQATTRRPRLSSIDLSSAW